MNHSAPDSEEKAALRGSSVAHDGPSGAKQPINDAITSVFGAASDGAAATSLPPEILAQITTHVIQQLKLSELNVGAESQQQLPTKQQAAPNSQPRARRGSLASATNPNPEAARVNSVYDAPASPRLGRATVAVPLSRKPAAEEAHLQPSTGDRSNNAVDSDRDDRSPRRRGPLGISNERDITIVERVWGDLFTEQGEATPRLGQFLRGIALHLIADYEPKHSLVITPEKMQRYYEETRLDNEVYPWRVVFDDRTSRISRMLREISAQHHLVQPPGQDNERPDVPGLTPQGFATWATLLIKAHPSLEFDRLAKTAREMPISNPDDPKERFPKEISRRLFPEHSDDVIAKKLQRAISVHCNVSFNARQDNNEETRSNASAANPKRGSVSASEPPVISSQAYETSSQPQEQEAAEQGSKIITHTDSGVIIDDDTPTTIPIERQRKPYVAAPGGGKSYDDQSLLGAESRPATTTEVKPSTSLPNVGRSDHQAKPRPISLQSPKPSSSTPVDIPELRRHRGSTTYREQPAPRRVRSPSVGQSNGYGRRSDSDHAYGSSYPSGSSVENGDTARRYREYDSIREKHSADRYDPARMAAFDGREREREREHERGHSRARGHSISTTPRTLYLTEEDIQKMYGGYPQSPAATTATAAPTVTAAATTAPPQSRDVPNIYVPPSTPLSAAYPPTAFRDSRAEASDAGRRAKDTEEGYGDYSRNSR